MRIKYKTGRKMVQPFLYALDARGNITGVDAGYPEKEAKRREALQRKIDKRIAAELNSSHRSA
jgi:hypothetical protein